MALDIKLLHYKAISFFCQSEYRKKPGVKNENLPGESSGREKRGREEKYILKRKKGGISPLRVFETKEDIGDL
ncbi:MAG: hypothetical protein AB1797_00200 [bacterium]